MRRLVYGTLGFAGSCGLWAYVENDWFRLGLVLVLLLFGALAGPDAKPMQRAALVLTGCILGACWCSGFERGYLGAAKAADGQVLELDIQVRDYGEQTDYGVACDGTVTLEGKPYRVRCYVPQEDFAPGDRIFGSFRLRFTAPGGLEEGTYHAGSGIFLLAYSQGAVEKKDLEPGYRDIPALLRRGIQEMLDRAFPADTLGFAKALLLGDTSGLDYKTDTHLKISGIRHVAAVSGLHVSILFAMLELVLGRNRWRMIALGLPALVLFAAVAGFSPSVNRACLMWGLMLLALVCGKEYDSPTALAFAVLVLLGVNPLAVTSVSLQLSAASVAGIYCFQKPVKKWMLSYFKELPKGSKRMVNGLCTPVAVSLSAMVFTTPLCAWYFGMVSLVGPLTNLLTLWIISIIFYGIMGVCAVSLVSLGAAKVLAAAVSWPIRYVLGVAQLLSQVPMAAVYTESFYIVAWLVLVYGLLGYFVLRSRDAGKLVCCAVLGLCLALLAGWGEGMMGQVSFTMLDVGQGQCLLIQSEGRNFLIDCGGDSDTASADQAAELLLSQGISRLDGIILTHLDSDHAAGAANLLTRMETNLLILPEEATALGNLISGQVIYASQDLLLEYGGTKIQIYPATFPGNSNEKSLCILFTTEKCDILITGDRSWVGEWVLLRQAELPQVDILVAGHHGAADSTCQELLAAVRPEVVCISAGRDNPYGHPAPELLERLAAFRCRVCRTDILGTFTIRR